MYSGPNERGEILRDLGSVNTMFSERQTRANAPSQIRSGREQEQGGGIPGYSK